MRSDSWNPWSCQLLEIEPRTSLRPTICHLLL
jgi:hypothetical protein